MNNNDDTTKAAAAADVPALPAVSFNEDEDEVERAQKQNDCRRAKTELSRKYSAELQACCQYFFPAEDAPKTERDSSTLADSNAVYLPILQIWACLL
eukprot:scaffold3037_cov142-Skeletonema_marinoi.AAC.1